jgi:hypothetical protein
MACKIARMRKYNRRYQRLRLLKGPEYVRTFVLSKLDQFMDSLESTG